MVDGGNLINYQIVECGYPVDGGYSEDVSIYVLHRERNEVNLSKPLDG